MRYVVAVLAALCIALVALALPLLPSNPPKGAPGDGDLVYRSGSYAVRLTSEPCQFRDFKDYLEDRGIPPARAIIVTQPGRPTLTGCWAYVIGGDVLTLDPTTPPDAMPTPIKWFERELRT